MPCWILCGCAVRCIHVRWTCIPHGSVTNYWGGSSKATTHLLEAMHYRGLLQVVRREAGIGIYGAREHEAGPRDPVTRRVHLDLLVDALVGKYAPLPASACPA